MRGDADLFRGRLDRVLCARNWLVFMQLGWWGVASGSKCMVWLHAMWALLLVKRMDTGV